MKQLGNSPMWAQRLIDPHGNELFLLGPNSLYPDISTLNVFDVVQGGWYYTLNSQVCMYLSEANELIINLFLSTLEPQLVSDLPDFSGFVKRKYLGERYDV